ncbi:MAG: large conductance mechanosensitive channel protein MscL [Eubacteriales bacterium]
MRKFIKEFRDFINKGNVIDMAVAVIIGGAFSPIVNALVNNIIMPVIGKLVGNMDFTDLKTVLTPAVLDEAGEVVTAEVAIGWGVLIGAVINFLIIALCIFVMLKIVLAAKNSSDKIKKAAKKGKGKEEAPAEPAEPAAPAAPVETDLDVLREIRDLLKSQEQK